MYRVLVCCGTCFGCGPNRAPLTFLIPFEIAGLKTAGFSKISRMTTCHWVGASNTKMEDAQLLVISGGGTSPSQAPQKIHPCLFHSLFFFVVNYASLLVKQENGTIFKKWYCPLCANIQWPWELSSNLFGSRTTVISHPKGREPDYKVGREPIVINGVLQ